MPTDDLTDSLPSPKREERGSTRIRVIAHGIAWGLLLALLAFGAPRLEFIFRDFGVDLPGVTVLVIRASHLVVGFVPLLLVLLGADWFLLDVLSRRGEVRPARAWSVLMLACPLLLILLAVIALGLPLLNIHGRLSG